jgi:hypothetical protein
MTAKELVKRLDQRAADRRTTQDARDLDRAAARCIERLVAVAEAVGRFRDAPRQEHLETRLNDAEYAAISEAFAALHAAACDLWKESTNV